MGCVVRGLVWNIIQQVTSRVFNSPLWLTVGRSHEIAVWYFISVLCTYLRNGFKAYYAYKGRDGFDAVLISDSVHFLLGLIVLGVGVSTATVHLLPQASICRWRSSSLVAHRDVPEGI
jgi:hypothetical protein